MIGFVGLSHLGIISGVAAASKGFEVLAYDSRASLISELKNGRLPLVETGLEAALKETTPRLRFSSDLKDLEACSLVYFSIDIRTDEANQSDLSDLTQLIQAALLHLKPGTTLVILSQVTPGFTRTFLETTLSKKLKLFYQVETLIFGQAWERATKPERIIVGALDPNSELPEEYLRFLKKFDCPVLKMRYESAELAKISINLCLVASLSVANTLSEICESIGADWSEIVPALRMDKRIGQHSYLNPGLGIAGGNLERDLVTVKNLSSIYGAEAGIASAFLANSTYRRDWVLRVLHEKLFSRCPKAVVAVWGLAYKPGTNSIKNSPALALIQSLPQVSFQVYDPQSTLPKDAFSNSSQMKTALQACSEADALVVMTGWEEFSKIELKDIETQLKGRLIVDPWAILNSSKAAAHGFSYSRLGVS